MGFFSFRKSKRAALQSGPVTEPHDIGSYDRAVSELLSPVSSGGMSVTVESALGLSTVWACIRILSESVGILPLHLYRRGANGRGKVTSHPVLSLLNEPNDYWNRFELLQWLMCGGLASGNGYARIHRDEHFTPIRLSFLLPASVHPFIDSRTGSLWYDVDGEILTPYDILHIKGLGTDPVRGKSPIAVHRENLALSLEAQAYGEQFFSRGGNVESVFRYPHALTKEQFKRLKGDLIREVAGMANAHKPMLLEGGMEYQRINIPLEDAQFIATRKFQRSEIAAIFGVPPHMIGDLDKATYNNTELMGIEYVTYSLMPWLVKIQSEFARKLLREDEKPSLYFAFQTNGLMRGDAKSRSEFYRNMSMIGAMNANEIRELEDMNSYPGGEKYFVQLNMTTAANAGENEPKKTKNE